jgi:hypothetical protein
MIMQIQEKPQFNKDKVDSSVLKEIKVKAGEPISIKLPIIGTPSPTLTWKQNGEPLKNR